MLYSIRITILIYIYTYNCKNLGCKKMDNLSEFEYYIKKFIEKNNLPYKQIAKNVKREYISVIN